MKEKRKPMRFSLQAGLCECVLKKGKACPCWVLQTGLYSCLLLSHIIRIKSY